MSQKKKGIADIVFVMDASGSMTECIDGLKNNIGMFIDTLTDVQSPLKDWRGKIVGYRDERFDEDWYVDNNFVSSTEELKSQLQNLEASGGGDEAESLLDALHKLALHPAQEKGAQSPDPTMWRYRKSAVRVVVVFTDASFVDTMTYDEGSGGKVSDVIDVLQTERIILFLFAPDTGGYEELSMTDKCEWEAIEEPYVDNLKNLSKDTPAFQKVLLALAQSISASIEGEVIGGEVEIL